MRTVPSMDTVRKAQRKILSSTCATNFQSCTTFVTKKGTDTEKSGQVTESASGSWFALKTRFSLQTKPLQPNSKKTSTNPSDEVLLLDVLADVAD